MSDDGYDFAIEREPGTSMFPYTVTYNRYRVPRVTMTLRGARWWIRHHGRKWAERQQNQSAVVVERHRV